PLAVQVAGIHARRVEGDVVRDRLVARGRRRVRPGRVLGRAARDRDAVVVRDALPLAEGRVARAREEPREPDVLGREVVGGRLARLQHPERARRAVEGWALVLAAAGIAHRVAPGAGEWRLLVAARDADRSIAALDGYDAERRSAPAPAEAPEYGRTYVGILVAVLLVAFYG